MKDQSKTKIINKKIKNKQNLNQYEIDFLKNKFNYFNFDMYKRCLEHKDKRFKYNDFLKWKTPLIDLGLTQINDELFFDRDPTKLSNTAIFGKQFYLDRYPEEYADVIWKSVKSKIVSIYDVDQIIIKHNVSKEEAKRIVQERKNKTRGTIENFIKRHGEEEGKKKYEVFKNKSKCTIENYKIRYGEEWEDKWNYYMNTRDSSSLDYWQTKLGIDKGKIKFDELVIEWRKSSDRQYYITKYGDEKGNLLFDELSVKKNNGLTKNSPFRLSKESQSFFVELEKELSDKCFYGKEEIRLVTDENKYYFYDFYHKKSNTIIEYNGSAFHPSPKLSTEEREYWRSIKSKDTADKISEYDKKKIDFALRLGYNLIVVWDYEIRGKKRTKEKVSELSEILHENIKSVKTKTSVE